MRLIDADALLAELNNLEVNCKNKYVKQGIDDGLHYYMPRILENEPTIDAVPVVRCKDCWSAIEIDGFMGGVLYCKFWGHDIDEECFCSYGERKGGDS